MSEFASATNAWAESDDMIGVKRELLASKMGYSGNLVAELGQEGKTLLE